MPLIKKKIFFLFYKKKLGVLYFTIFYSFFIFYKFVVTYKILNAKITRYNIMIYLMIDLENEK